MTCRLLTFCKKRDGGGESERDARMRQERKENDEKGEVAKEKKRERKREREKESNKREEKWPRGKTSQKKEAKRDCRRTCIQGFYGSTNTSALLVWACWAMPTWQQSYNTSC